MRKGMAMKRMWAALLYVLASAMAHAVDLEGSRAASVTKVTSLEEAEQVLSLVQAERSRITSRYAEQEQACYQRFFVNRCIDEARQQRRDAMQPLDALELEAERFEREQRAEQRERGVQQRRAEAQEKAEQAARVEPPPSRKPLLPVEPQGKPRARKAEAPPMQEQAQARERAENEQAYARKLAAAKARQEAVARRKAEKAQRAAMAEAAGAK